MVSGRQKRLGRRNWRESDARRALAELAASGLTVADFARRSGVPGSRLRWWRERLGAGVAAKTGAAAEFVPVRMVPEARPTVGSTMGALEIAIGDSLVIRVARDFDEVTLVRLAHALARAC